MKKILRSIFLLVIFTLSFGLFCFGQIQLESHLFPITVKRKVGFIDQTGKVIIEPQFDGADNFYEGLARVYTRGKFTTAYIDKTGKIVIEPQFDIGSQFSEGLAWVGFDPTKTEYKIGNLTVYGSTQGTHSFIYNIGFIDTTGKMVIEAKFKFANNFSEGLAAVKTKDEKFGFIDKRGKFVIEPTFEWASSFSEGLAAVVKGNKHGFIDKKGKFVIKPQFTDADSFSEGLACVKIGGQFREASIGVQMITTTIDDTNYAFINKKGKVVFKIKAGQVHPFSEGLARFEPFGDYRHGFIDKRGNVVIQPIFSGSSDFHDGLATVIIDKGGFGWIDKSGKVVLKSDFPFAGKFENGLASVSNNTTLYDAQFGYIDKTGKVIWQPTK